MLLSGTGPGAIFLIAKQRGRIVSNAVVQLQETNGLDSAQLQVVQCTQYAAPVDADGNVTGQYEPFGRPTTATLSGRAQETGQLALTGGKAVEAGNYDVAVYCLQVSGDATVKSTGADLTSQVAGLSEA